MSVRLDRAVRTDRLWRWVLAAVVLGVGALGYVLWIPVRHPDPARVAALVVKTPVTGFLAHPRTAESDAAVSPLAAVKAAASATPGQTAVYTVAWKGETKKSASAVVVLALPTARDTTAARADAKKSYLSTTSLTSEGFGYSGTLSLPSVPGAAGATFVAGTSPSVTATTRRTDAEVFSVGRVVAIATAQGKGAQAKTAVDALALAEYHHLRHVGARPSLAETSFPAVASLVYALVVAGVLAVGLLGPWALVAVRRRRIAAWEAAARRERASRGSKVVKRHAGRTQAARSGLRRSTGTRGTRR